MERKVAGVAWLTSHRLAQVVETETYINELLGNPKEKESLTGMLLNTRVVQLKMGRIDVRFKKPFSLAGWLKEEEARRASLPQADAPRDPRKEQGTLLKALGYQVLADINSVAVIMPAALVGTVMLTIRGRVSRGGSHAAARLLTPCAILQGVGKTELLNRIIWLKNAIEKRGGRVADFAKMDLEAVVERYSTSLDVSGETLLTPSPLRTLVVLKDVIGEHKNLIEPTYYPSNRFELSFYRNQVSPAEASLSRSGC